MRHLKAFESISTQVDYWELVEYSSLSVKISKSQIDMTQRSIDVLRSVLYPQFHFGIEGVTLSLSNIQLADSNKFGGVRATPTGEYRQFRTLSTSALLIRKRRDVEELRSISFIQKEDEWYVIKFSCQGWVVYYECDQIEGVVHCLRDLGIIK